MIRTDIIENNLADFSNAEGRGSAKVKCSLKYPPPRGKKRAAKYQACVETESKKIVLKRKERKEQGKRVWDKIKKYFPALVIPRNSYLALMRLNFANIAGRASKVMQKDPTKWQSAQDRWKKLGGDVDSLKKAIDAGKNKKPIFGKPKKKGADGKTEWAIDTGYSNSAGGVDVAALITSGATIIAALAPFFGGSSDDIQEASDAWIDQSGMDSTDADDLKSQINEDYILGMPAMVVYVGGGILGVGLLGTIIYFAVKAGKT
jgi:hypothetical protein